MYWYSAHRLKIASEIRGIKQYKSWQFLPFSIQKLTIFFIGISLCARVWVKKNRNIFMWSQNNFIED